MNRTLLILLVVLGCRGGASDSDLEIEGPHLETAQGGAALATPTSAVPPVPEQESEFDGDDGPPKSRCGPGCCLSCGGASGRNCGPCAGYVPGDANDPRPGFPGGLQPDCPGPVYIRVLNASKLYFETVAFGGIEYGALRAGAASDYRRAVGCRHANDHSEITASERGPGAPREPSPKQRYVVFPIDFVGEATLRPGYYTSALRPEPSGDVRFPGGVNVRVLRDGMAPGPPKPVAPLTVQEEIELGSTATDPLDEQKARQQMDLAAREASKCSSVGSERGSGQVQVTVASWGRVLHVAHSSHTFAFTEVGWCVAEAFQRVRVPPFRGHLQTMSGTAGSLTGSFEIR